MEVGGGGIAVCARLPLLAVSGDGRCLAHLKMSDMMPLGRWRGFKLHSSAAEFSVTQLGGGYSNLCNSTCSDLSVNFSMFSQHL